MLLGICSTNFKYIIMSTANKLRAKHQHIHHDNSPQNNITNSQPVTTPSNNQDNSQKYNQKQEVEDISSREGQFQKYYGYVEGNPVGVVPSASLFPANYSLYAEHNIPLGFEVSPVLPLCNQGTAISQKPLQMIPQCSSCRAFLNSYNKIKQDTFTCFLCQAKNPIPKQYTFNKSEPQHNHSLYRTACPSTTDETSYVFLVDVSPESARCKALYYFVEAVKHVFSRDSLDQVVVFFFTFDQTVHHYHFQGQDVKCLIYDQTIDQGSVVSCMKGLKLGQIREKLFSVLDSLEQMSINNKRQGSNFTKCFDYVYNSLRTTNSKFLILQCNQQITGQQMFSEQCAPNTKTPQKVRVKPQSRLQTENKTLINKYTNNLLNHQCGFSLFIFATNFKNVRVFSDFIKLSSSQIKLYSKNHPALQELNRFYFELIYFLGVQYARSLYLQIIPGRDWYFTAVYGNFRKLNQNISFNFPYFEPSRKIHIMISPSKYSNKVLPYCSFQIIAKYKYNGQNHTYIATIVQPVTSQFDRLYEGLNMPVICCVFGKMFLSGLRMDNADKARNQFIEMIRNLYQSALRYYKKQENLPDSIFHIVKFVFSCLKSYQNQPDLNHSTQLFDRVIAERNFLQSCGHAEMFAQYNPYLFDLSNITQEMCLDHEQGQFVYPPTVEVSFANTRQGIFLMDCGICLYLFIGKIYNPDITKQLFGHKKLNNLTEEDLEDQDTKLAVKVRRLIQYLRQDKSYGWVPLYVVRCGEGSEVQRFYYLQYFGEKYQGFRMYNFRMPQFIGILTNN